MVATTLGPALARQVSFSLRLRDRAQQDCYRRIMWCITMYIPGNDPETYLLRKTLLRNANLMAVLVLRSISDSVRKRLKTLEDVVEAGKMLRPDYLRDLKTENNGLSRKDS